MRSRSFKQVDVFTGVPYTGNPVAVVLEGEGLSAADMQGIARWTNLSETTFVLPPTAPEADYQVRIFDPRHELPFAGHPSVGTAYALLEAGVVDPGSGTLHQQCLAGVLALRVEGEGGARRVFVRVPEAKLGAADAEIDDAVGRALGAKLAAGRSSLAVDVGPVWLVAQLASAEVVRAVKPDLTAITELSRELGLAGVTIFGPATGEDVAYEVRSFAPIAGIPEDPVCGSGNASVAAYRVATDGLETASWTAAQGCALERCGRVEVRVAEGGRSIEVGGACVTCIDGLIEA